MFWGLWHKFSLSFVLGCGDRSSSEVSSGFACPDGEGGSFIVKDVADVLGEIPSIDVLVGLRGGLGILVSERTLSCPGPTLAIKRVTEATACGNLDLTMTPGYLHVVVKDLLCAPAPARGPRRGWRPSSGR